MCFLGIRKNDFTVRLKTHWKQFGFMPQDHKPVEETGTYSTYYNKKNLQVIEKVGLSGLPPAKVVDELTKMADKYHENKKVRNQERERLEREISELQKREESEVWN